MTAEPPPNCETCQNKSCAESPNGVHSIDTREYWEFTKKYGCLSHPGARAWLMKDELSALQHTRDAISPCGEFERGMIGMLDHAITLIKIGVEK